MCEVSNPVLVSFLKCVSNKHRLCVEKFLWYGCPRPKYFWDLLKNEIPRRSFMKIFTKSNSSEDLRWISSETLGKIFRRKDFKNIWIKTFSLKDLYIDFLQKIFNQFLPKFFLKMSDIFWRSSIKIFKSYLRSTWDFLVFVLIFSFEKKLSNN